MKIPWVSIFTSLPVWAIIVAHFGENWGFYTLLTELPSYLKHHLKFDLTHVSFSSWLPVRSILSQFQDWEIKHPYFTKFLPFARSLQGCLRCPPLPNEDQNNVLMKKSGNCEQVDLVY